MNTLDILIIFGWVAATLLIGAAAGWRASGEQYWVSGRSASLFPLVASVVATQVGAGAIIGIASSTYSTGTGFGGVALFSTVSGFVLLGVLAPKLKTFGDSVHAVTLPAFLRQRFGRSTQVAGAAVVLFTYIALLAAQFTATSNLLALNLNWDFRVALAVSAVVGVAYSAFAGVRGDIATDLVHFLVMGFFVVLVMPWFLLANHDVGRTLAAVPGSVWDPRTFGGWTYIIAGVLFSASVPLLAPELWVKVYSAKSPTEARRMMWWSAAGCIPFYLAAIFLGAFARGAYGEGAGGDSVVFKLMLDNLPHGFLGLGVAGILAVIFSTVNTLILVIGATVVRDLIDPTPSKEMALARFIAVASGALGAVFAFVAPGLVNLLLAAFFMLLVLAPSMIGGALWSRASGTAATWSIAIGALLTLAALSFAPTVAFLPGVGGAIVTFLLITFSTPARAADRDEGTILRDHP